MNIRELEEKTGYSARQIRFLISEGFMPSPEGSRTKPDYTDQHIEAIQRYQVAREAGLTPKVIHFMKRQDVQQDSIKFSLGEGIEVSCQISKIDFGKTDEMSEEFRKMINGMAIGR